MKIKKIFRYAYVLPTLFLFGLLFYYSVTNLDILTQKGQLAPAKNFVEYSTTFENKISEGFKDKYAYINLNGKMTNALGVNSLNNITKLDNGHLVFSFEPSNTTELSDKLSQVSDLLKQDNIEFLSVAVPHKACFYDTEFPAGYGENYAYLLDDLEKELNAKGVNHINANAFFEQKDMTMDDVYFKTDHHWRPSAAFSITEEIMRKLNEQNSDIIYSKDSFSEENWQTDIYKDWFLGSNGKRTGKDYTGVDDFEFIYPKFETDITVDRITKTRAVPDKNRNTFYYTGYLDQPDYFAENSYCTYLGGDFPLAYIRNSKAINNKKLVIIGDSYRLPVESFLSTQFSEIYRIDTRYFNDGTFLELVKAVKPDLVISLYTNLSINSGVHNYGVDQWNQNFASKNTEVTISEPKDISLRTAKNNNDYYVLKSNIISGAYKLSANEVTLKKGKKQVNNLVQAAVIDLKSQTIIASRYFMPDYNEAQDWYFTVPKNKNANYAVVIYNGTFANTLNKKAELKEVSITKFK